MTIKTVNDLVKEFSNNKDTFGESKKVEEIQKTLSEKVEQMLLDYFERKNPNLPFVIDVQPGDPDTFEMANIVLNTLQKVHGTDVAKNVTVCVANPITSSNTAYYSNHGEKDGFYSYTA